MRSDFGGIDFDAHYYETEDCYRDCIDKLSLLDANDDIVLERTDTIMVRKRPGPED